jgi:hypothetical protein
LFDNDKVQKACITARINQKSGKMGRMSHEKIVFREYLTAETSGSSFPIPYLFF